MTVRRMVQCFTISAVITYGQGTLRALLNDTTLWIYNTVLEVVVL